MSAYYRLAIDRLSNDRRPIIERRKGHVSVMQSRNEQSSKSGSRPQMNLHSKTNLCLVKQSLTPDYKLDSSVHIRIHTFLILDLGLDVVNGVARLHLQRDCFPGQSFNKNLHATTQTQHQMEGRFLLNVVVRQRATILKLLTSEDQALLVGRNSCRQQLFYKTVPCDAEVCIYVLIMMGQFANRGNTNIVLTTATAKAAKLNRM